MSCAKVAQWFAIYAFIAPLVHGFIGFGVGLLIHKITGFSIVAAVVLAVIAASSSDIFGSSDPASWHSHGESSAYIGASTAIGNFQWRSPSAFRSHRIASDDRWLSF